MVSIMDTEANLVNSTTIDAVLYELYKPIFEFNPGGIVRVFDLGAREVVTITRYPRFAAAEDAYKQAIAAVE